jgi:hypothetical protein
VVRGEKKKRHHIKKNPHTINLALPNILKKITKPREKHTITIPCKNYPYTCFYPCFKHNFKKIEKNTKKITKF